MDVSFSELLVLLLAILNLIQAIVFAAFAFVTNSRRQQTSKTEPEEDVT